MGTTMMNWAMDRTRQLAGGRPCSLFVVVRDNAMGLRRLVETLGFEPTRYFNMLHYDRLPEQPPDPVRQLPPGLVVRTYRPEFATEYAEGLNQLFHRGVTDRDVDQVTREPEFDPELWFFALADGKGPDGERGRMVGFCTCDMYSEHDGEVAFLGVYPSHRRRGLGSALLALAIRALAQKGCTNIHLSVNVQDDSALRLYERMGFVLWRRSITYEKRID